jgi:hypothetical protein
MNEQSPLGWIVDTLSPFRDPIPFDLLRRTNSVIDPYSKVLEGKITDPQEVKEITNRFNDWYEQIKQYRNIT